MSNQAYSEASHGQLLTVSFSPSHDCKASHGQLLTVARSHEAPHLTVIHGDCEAPHW